MGARPAKEPRQVDDGPACRPLLTPDALITWAPSAEEEACRATVTLQQARDGGAQACRPRLLACHDMRGGYLEDRLVQGGRDAAFYYFRHWSSIDMFVYFSHSLVTIPPPGWTNAGHRHGVQVLGTFITEWDAGRAACERLFASSEAAEACAAQLADMAAYYRFDGWLVNIENPLAAGTVPHLVHFLRALTERMHDRVPGSLVVWYDAVTTEGRLDWQNTLNALNRPFFDACDAVWINYTWKEGTPAQVAMQAGSRRHDVFMGVDCFGRGTYGGGGYACDVALRAAASQGLSAALFATAWPFECPTVPTEGGGVPSWQECDSHFWQRITASVNIERELVLTLPCYTNFDAGRGLAYACQGRAVSCSPWFNLSLQSLLPSLHISPQSAEQSLSVRLSNRAAWSGGGCLALGGSLTGSARISLFRADVPLPAEGLLVQLTAVAGPQVQLALELECQAPGLGRPATISLEVATTSLDEGTGSVQESGTITTPTLRARPDSFAREPLSFFPTSPSSGRADKGRAAGGGPCSREWVTCTYRLASERLAHALGFALPDARLAAFSLLLSGSPDLPCSVDTLLGEVRVAPMGQEAPLLAPVERLAARDVQVASRQEAGGPAMRELALWLTWQAPADTRSDRATVWVEFLEQEPGVPTEGASAYIASGRVPRWLGIACASCYKAAALPVPKAATHAAFRVQALGPCGEAQPLADCAILVVPCGPAA